MSPTSRMLLWRMQNAFEITTVLSAVTSVGCLRACIKTCTAATVLKWCNPRSLLGASILEAFLAVSELSSMNPRPNILAIGLRAMKTAASVARHLGRSCSDKWGWAHRQAVKPRGRYLSFTGCRCFEEEQVIAATTMPTAVLSAYSFRSAL